jgi:hypothetical protein
MRYVAFVVGKTIWCSSLIHGSRAAQISHPWSELKRTTPHVPELRKIDWIRRGAQLLRPIAPASRYRRSSQIKNSLTLTSCTIGVAGSSNNRFERSRGSSFDGPRGKVDDLDKMVPFVVSATPRRSTSSLDD